MVPAEAVDATPPSAMESSAEASSGVISMELVWSPVRGEWRRLALTLPAGSTVADALRASDWFEDPLPTTIKTGLWGKLRPLTTPLRAGDRVEVYRPLTVDPKEARRQRYKATGQRIVTRHRPLGRKA